CGVWRRVSSPASSPVERQGAASLPSAASLRHGVKKNVTALLTFVSGSVTYIAFSPDVSVAAWRQSRARPRPRASAVPARGLAPRARAALGIISPVLG